MVVDPRHIDVLIDPGKRPFDADGVIRAGVSAADAVTILYTHRRRAMDRGGMRVGACEDSVFREEMT